MLSCMFFIKMSHNSIGMSDRDSEIKKDGASKMETIKKPNHSISCTVSQCANHAKTCDYCALEKVFIGTHEKNPTVVQCVDCESFVLSPNCTKDGCKTK